MSVQNEKSNPEPKEEAAMGDISLDELISDLAEMYRDTKLVRPRAWETKIRMLSADIAKLKLLKQKNRAIAAEERRNQIKPSVLLIPFFESHEKWQEIAMKHQEDLLQEAEET